MTFPEPQNVTQLANRVTADVTDPIKMRSYWRRSGPCKKRRNPATDTHIEENVT